MYTSNDLDLLKVIHNQYPGECRHVENIGIYFVF